MISPQMTRWLAQPESANHLIPAGSWEIFQVLWFFFLKHHLYLAYEISPA